MKGDVGNVSQLGKTLYYLTVPGYLCFVFDEPQAWYRGYIQFTILLNWLIRSPIIKNIESIVITEIKIRFPLPDLTLVQSEVVVLSVLGYSRTQHPAFYDEGILSVSGHCHLGELY